MDLRIFTTSLPRGEMSALASKIGISPIYLSQLAARQNGREPKPALCVLIECATEMGVRRWDLRPKDWSRIWPELIGVEGAPPVPEIAALTPSEAAQA